MWIVAAILGIFLFFVLLLAIPVDLVFDIEKDDDFRSSVRVRWFFGLIGKDIRGKKEGPDRDKKKKKKKGKEGKSNLKTFLEMWKVRGILSKLFGFIRDVIRLLNIRRLKIYFRVGLDNPADTGMLFAAAGPAALLLRRSSSVDIEFEPDFERENLSGYLQGDIRIIPIKFIRPAARLMFSITTLRAIKTIIGARRR